VLLESVQVPERHTRSARTNAAITPPAPGGPPIMVSRSSFPLVRGVHGNGLRSRERRFES